MRKGFLASVAGLIAQGGMALAQATAQVEPVYPQSASPAAQVEMAPMPGQLSGPALGAHVPLEGHVIQPDWNCDSCQANHEDRCQPRCWGSAEYLLWFVRNGPAPALVTTGDPAEAVPGGLGVPSTQVLFGGSGLDYGTFSGTRLTIGGWLHNQRTWGVEASGFLLERRSVGFAANSDSNGSPPLYIPFFNTQTNAEGSFTIADPNFGFAGSVAVSSSTRLWGTEVNALRHLVSTGNFEVDFLAGFRYLDLRESIGITAYANDLLNDIQTFGYDSFSTRNQFYGGQVGARIGYRRGPLGVDFIGKVALGHTSQFVNTAGGVTVTGSGAPNGAFPGSVFTQPTNISRQEGDEFAVVPQVQLKVGYQIRPRLRLSVGYDFLFWSQVARPGNQIDRNLNLTAVPGGTAVSPASPIAQFNRSDFFAHGLNFGLEFCY